MPVLPSSMNLEDYEEMMIANGWKKKVIDGIKHPHAYRSWYYRIRKLHVIHHNFHIEAPGTFWFKPIEDFLRDSRAMEETEK